MNISNPDMLTTGPKPMSVIYEIAPRIIGVADKLPKDIDRCSVIYQPRRPGECLRGPQFFKAALRKVQAAAFGDSNYSEGLRVLAEAILEEYEASHASADCLSRIVYPDTTGQ